MSIHSARYIYSESIIYIQYSVYKTLFMIMLYPDRKNFIFKVM